MQMSQSMLDNYNAAKRKQERKDSVTPAAFKTIVRVSAIAVISGQATVGEVLSDMKNYDPYNTSETKVLEANAFSVYKQTFVVKPALNGNAASFGILVISNDITSTDTVKHEYGHRVQWDNMGMDSYIANVAIPSVTANVLARMGKLPYDYYGSPWEAEADRLGGVHRVKDNTPWPDGAYSSYRDLIRMFTR